MDTHHEAPYSCHVVDVGKADQANSSQVMDEHDQEVLKLKKGEGWLAYMYTKCLPVNSCVVV